MLLIWIHRMYLDWQISFTTSISLWIRFYLKNKISSSLIFSLDGTISSKPSHGLPMLLALDKNKYLLWVHSLQSSSLSALDPDSRENKTIWGTQLKQGSLFLALSPDSGQILSNLYSLGRWDGASFYGKVDVNVDALGFTITHIRQYSFIE